ncbi:MAG: class I SAM-dependent methyltransferase [Candidatus Delongbacteria bacterium]|nr:class I SAM-dependent methyltransferase [Candidatus Delongbacteria bacterium]MCG2761405.1 class I SAM-dependent methyltransferase [Candidatus Delongbacteria bacterium]
MSNRIRENYEFYKKKYYSGSDIFCPFCPGFFKLIKYRFFDSPVLDCPVCSSTIDERTILLFLQTKTGMMSGELKILIIAEEGRITDYFKNFPNTEIKIYSETGDFSIRDNSLKNKYTDESFGLIVCNYILEKLPEYKSVIKELKRILKPEGLLMLQANLDYKNEKTVEMPLTHYKDRFMMYGIPGNYRRFGMDYADIIKSYGLNLSRLMFSSGFDGLPDNSLKKDEVIYLVYKTEFPKIMDNMDILEDEIAVQKSNSGGGALTGLMYIVFFILPEIFKKSLFSFAGNINESEDNKGKFIYMLYITILGLTIYWGTLIFFISTENLIVHWLFAAPVYVLGGFGALSIMGGYVFLNDQAGIFKKIIVGFFLFMSLWLPFVAGFFK